MMDIDAIGIGVETRQVKQASKDLDKLGASADRASRKADGLSTANKGVESTSSIAARSVGKLAAAYAALQSFRALGGMIDTYTKFNAQLKIAARTQDDFTQSYQDVVRISNLAQSGIEGTATLYARLANTLKDTNVTQQQFANITESVALGLRVSGASAGEAQSAMLQLSQAFASGVLRGEEFNAVSEASFPLMKALADSMGIPIEQLRSMAMEGLITRDELVKAFSDPRLIETFRTQAKEVQTMGGAVTNAKNEFLLFVGNVAKKTGIVDLFTTAINGGSQALRSFNSLLTTGKFKLDAFLPAYDKYRQKMDEEAKKAGLAPKKFGFAGRIGDAITADEIAGIPSLGGILTASDPKKKADEIIKASGNASKAISSDAERLAREQQEFDLRMYQIEVEQAEAAREWKKGIEEEAEKERIEALDRWMKYQQKRADENFKAAQAANEKFEQERRREAERTSDIISRSLTDALLRGFESGKSFAENFIDTLKNMFKTLVLQPVVKFLVDASGITGVLGALGGAFSGSANAATGGNSIMGALGGIKDVLGSLNGSLVSSIENLGVFLSTGNGGLGDMIGGALGQYSGAISQALPFAGAALQLFSGDIKGGLVTAGFTAAGTAIGGPIGGAIGSVIGKVVGGLFGGEDYDRFGTFVTGAKSTRGGYYETGRGVIYDKDIGAADPLNQLSKRFADVLTSLFGSFGVNQSVETYAGIYQRGKSGVSGGNFNSNLTGPMTVALKDADMKTLFETFANKVMGEGLIKAIQNSKLPQNIKKFFDGLTNETEVLQTTQAILGVKEALVSLPPVFKALAFEINTNKFKSNAQQLTARFAAVQQFTNLFYTDSEKLHTAYKQFHRQFKLLGQDLPSTRDEFRALIDNFKVFDEASANTFYGLVSLAPALSNYYDELTRQKDALDALNNTMRSSDNFSNIVDFQRYQAIGNNFGTRSANTLLSDSPAVIGILKELKNEIVVLQKSSKKTADLLTQVTLDGQALQTQAAA